MKASCWQIADLVGLSTASKMLIIFSLFISELCYDDKLPAHFPADVFVFSATFMVGEIRDFEDTNGDFQY